MVITHIVSSYRAERFYDNRRTSFLSSSSSSSSSLSRQKQKNVNILLLLLLPSVGWPPLKPWRELEEQVSIYAAAAVASIRQVGT
jgi:hypothetical protein